MCIWIIKERFKENGINIYKIVYVYIVKFFVVVKMG